MPDWRILFSILFHVLLLKQIDNSEKWLNINIKLNAAKRDIINTFDLFIYSEEKRLNSINKLVQTFNFTQKNCPTTEGCAEIFVGHPVNSYSLMKKVTHDWTQLKVLMKSDSFHAESFRENAEEIESKLSPTFKALNDTIYAIGKIQEMNKLLAKDIAVGLWGELTLNFNLTYQECVKIGKYFYDNMNYSLASQWLEMGLEKCNNKVNDTEFIYLLSKSEFLNGYHDKLGKHLSILPYDGFSTDNKRYFSDHIARVFKIETLPTGSIMNQNRIVAKNLCKRILRTTSNSDKSLKCRYNNYNSHFLKLAPLKEEILSYEPPVKLFRNVLSEDEINVIKDVATRRLTVAEAYKNINTSEPNIEIRFCETGFIEHDYHRATQRVMNRIKDISTYETKYGDELQALEYPPGGHVVRHIDAFFPGSSSLKKLGNRMATVLFYMNDVKMGGHTGFTQLDLLVKPEKGSALVWDNVFSNGTIDERTEHCSCPVMVGHKLAVNAWIRELGQTLKCALM